MKKEWIIIIVLIIASAALVYFSYFHQGKTIVTDNSVPSSSEGDREVPVLDLIPAKKVSLIAVGDVMLSRSVDSAIKRHGDYKYPFLKTTDLLKSADITFGNLETAITPGRQVVSGEMMFRSDPEVVEGLNLAGFDILSLANNHSMNFGQQGIKDTFQYLNEAGIEYIGAGNDKAEARQPVIFEVKGLKFAFLAYTDTDVVPASYEASSSRAGNAFMNVAEMQEDVNGVKGSVDFVIISMHSGSEYVPGPNSRQTNFARQAVEAGTALVIGHHPHVTQTMEKYQDGYILYSLGNFVFDQMWSEETRRGLIAEIIFNADGIQEFEFYPVVIEDYAQPRYANSTEEEEILNRLGFDLSKQPQHYWSNQAYQSGERKGIYLAGPNLFRQTELEFDLDGDGQLEKATIENEIAYFYKDNKIIWQSEEDWRAENVLFGDIDNDDQDEFMVTYWKFGKYGPDYPFWLEENIDDWGNHLFIYKWQDNELKLFWGSSTLDQPIREMALADMNNDDLNDLVVLEGNYQDSYSDSAKYVTVWQWKEWSMFNEYRSEELNFFDLGIKDLGTIKVIYARSY